MKVSMNEVQKGIRKSFSDFGCLNPITWTKRSKKGKGSYTRKGKQNQSIMKRTGGK